MALAGPGGKERLNMGADQILITGADGYMGSRMAQRYLDDTDARLVLWMRARDAEEGRRKRLAMETRLGDAGPRVQYAWGDLENPQPFAGLDPGPVYAIVHSAAIIRFNVEEDLAKRVNVAGTEKLLRFAARCPRLESIGLLSSVYASGLQSGVIGETAFDGRAGFANHYERSKWESETLLSGYASLPWKVCRLATAIADDEDGRITQYNAFHNTLKLFHYGLMSLVPGRAETPLYFITGNSAAQAVFRIMQKGSVRTHFHISHARADSITLGRLVDAAFDEFNRDPAFRSRRILPPLFSDAASFDLLSEGVRSFAGGIVQQSVSSMAPFTRQLFVDKDILNRNLEETLAGTYRAPDAESLIRNACRYLIATRWGREAGPA
jgi:nucleoside-diphosphate-sugar epimerase